MTNNLTCFADVALAVRAATNMVELDRVVQQVDICYMAAQQILHMADTEWWEFNEILSVKRAELLSMVPIVQLSCSCCSGSTKGRQWHNLDNGYGLCSKCAVWLKGKESPEVMRSNYGIAGYHYFEVEV